MMGGKYPLLVILDLNGTLMHRTKHFTGGVPSATTAAVAAATPDIGDADFELWRGRVLHRVWYRPYMDCFLRRLLDRFDVAVWTSMKQANAEPLVKDVARLQAAPLAFRWFRDECTLRPTAADADASTKDLAKVYARFPGRFSAANTVLVDDSPAKAAAHPLNAIHLPTFAGATDDTALLAVLHYLVRMADLGVRDVREYMRHSPLFAGTSAPATAAFRELAGPLAATAAEQTAAGFATRREAELLKRPKKPRSRAGAKEIAANL